MHRFPLALALLLTALASSRAASPPAGIVPPNAPKSSFVDEQGLGRDPFFPDSARRAATVVIPVDPNANRPNVDFLTLKGISITGGRKLAIINNYTVAEGEDFSLRSGNQVTKIKCVEIKERLVVVEVNGVTKELPLRASLN